MTRPESIAAERLRGGVDRLGSLDRQGVCRVDEKVVTGSADQPFQVTPCPGTHSSEGPGRELSLRWNRQRPSEASAGCGGARPGGSEKSPGRATGAALAAGEIGQQPTNHGDDLPVTTTWGIARCAAVVHVERAGSPRPVVLKGSCARLRVWPRRADHRALCGRIVAIIVVFGRGRRD
jgi:hypothetical protein